MSDNRKDYNRAETKRHIRSVFLDIYKEKGIYGLTINELCNKAGIVKSTFYTYFEDKYSVLEEIEQDLLEGMDKVNEGLVNLELTPVLQGRPLPQASRSVDFILEHFDEYKALLGPKGDPLFEVRWRRYIEADFKERFQREKGNEPTADLACAIFASTLMGIYRYFIFNDPNISKENFALILGNTFKYALQDFLTSTKKEP